MTMQKNIRIAKTKTLRGSMGLVFLLALLVCSLGFPYSSKAQTITEEIVTGQETSPNYLPNMDQFTTSGGTKHNTGSGTSQGCKSGNFCTAGKQGPGGTYSSTFDLKENMTIDQINRGFTMDYGMDVDSHVSNSVLASCVGGNVMQNSDCRDIVKLTVTLLDTGIVKHTFEHELEMDFSGVRTFGFSQTIPQNNFNDLTGTFNLFGIDAGFGSRFFGPAFLNPTLTTTFDLVTIIETEVIDIINDVITDNPNIDIQPNDVTDVQVEVTTQDGQQMASLEIEVNTEIQVETNFEVPVQTAPAETVQVQAEVSAEVETEMSNVADAEPTTDQPVESTDSTESGTDTGNEQESEPEQTAEAEPREQEGESQPESTETSSESETESNNESEASEKPKPKVKVASKKSAKQKAANKIVKKMGDKGRYDSTNQLKTLVVMNVLGNSRQFIDPTKIIPDTPGFFDNRTIPDASISDNNYASYFLFGGSDASHNALIESQYK